MQAEKYFNNPAGSRKRVGEDGEEPKDSSSSLRDQINVRNVLIAAAVQMCGLPFDSWPSF